MTWQMPRLIWVFMGAQFIFLFCRAAIHMVSSYELPRDKNNKMTVGPEKTDQPRHSPSLISVFAVRMKKAWVLSYPSSTQRRLWSDWADAQVDLSLLGAQSFCWFCHEVAHMKIIVGHTSLDHVTLTYHMSRSKTKQKKNELCAHKDTDQPGHPPSLIRVFTMRMKISLLGP